MNSDGHIVVQVKTFVSHSSRGRRSRRRIGPSKQPFVVESINVLKHPGFWLHRLSVQIFVTQHLEDSICVPRVEGRVLVHFSQDSVAAGLCPIGGFTVARHDE